MKFTLKVALPTADEIGAGLTRRAAHPGLELAEIAERQRAQDVEDAKVNLAEAIRRAESVAADVQAGRVGAEELAIAVRNRQACALRVQPAEAALREATAHRERAEAVAVERVIEEARERNERLERTAAEVAPLLEYLTELEQELERAASHAIGRPANLPAVDWPLSLRDQNLDRRSQIRGTAQR